MDDEAFRSHAHGAADWIADYFQRVESLPVRPSTPPGSVADRLPNEPPFHGEPMARILEDFEATIMPGMTHWQHPRFFAYFPANASPASIIAEYLTAGLAAQCMLWQTSPAATEVEARMVDWMRQALGLPPGFGGVIQDSASSATLSAVLTMRERALEWRGIESGMAG